MFIFWGILIKFISAELGRELFERSDLSHYIFDRQDVCKHRSSPYPRGGKLVRFHFPPIDFLILYIYSISFMHGRRSPPLMHFRQFIKIYSGITLES